jgi:hypothetical protein
LHCHVKQPGNNYDAFDSEAYESFDVGIVDNIVIPAGARGVCIRPDSKHFVVDFGEGVKVPFVLTDESNRPKDKLIIGERLYRLVTGHHKARLYFDPGFLEHKKSTPGK